MPKSRRSRGSRRAPKGSAFQKAPLQGMGETYTWKTNDIQVVSFPAPVGNGAYALRVANDVNGFAWVISQAGGTIVASSTTSGFNQALYAENNSQFVRLASLWQEYRVDSIAYEWQPTGLGGQVNMTSAIAVNDEAGQLQGTAPIADVQERLSSQKNLHLHTPYMKLKRRMNMAGWIGQTQERAWLQTQLPDTAQIVREVYETPITAVNLTDNKVGRTPALAVAAGFNFAGGSLFTSPVVVGTIIFTAQFTFRQRRSLTSDPFADQTLLFEDSDGKHFKRSLTGEEVTQVIGILDGAVKPISVEDVAMEKPSGLPSELTQSLIERIRLAV